MLTGIIFKLYGTTSFCHEITNLYLFTIHKTKYQAINPSRVEFFQNILRQTVAPRSVGV